MHQDTLKVEQYVIMSDSPDPFHKRGEKLLITKCSRQTNTQHCRSKKAQPQSQSRETVNVLYCLQKYTKEALQTRLRLSH